MSSDSSFWRSVIQTTPIHSPPYDDCFLSIITSIKARLDPAQPISESIFLSFSRILLTLFGSRPLSVLTGEEKYAVVETLEAVVMVFVSHIFPLVLNACLLQLPSILPESCHLVVEILKAVEDQTEHYGNYSLQSRVLAAKYLIYGDAGISLLLSLYLTPNDPTTIADYQSQLSLQDSHTDIPVASTSLATTLDVKSCPSLLPPTPLSPPSPLGCQDTGYVPMTTEQEPPPQTCDDRSSLSPLFSPMPLAAECADQHPDTHTDTLSCDSSVALVLSIAEYVPAEHAVNPMASNNDFATPRQAINLSPSSERSLSSLYSALPLADIVVSQQNQLEGSFDSHRTQESTCETASESLNIASGVEQGCMFMSPSIPAKRKSKVEKENSDSKPSKKGMKSEPLPNPSKRHPDDDQVMMLAQQPERITRSRIVRSFVAHSGTKSVINRGDKA